MIQIELKKNEFLEMYNHFTKFNNSWNSVLSDIRRLSSIGIHFDQQLRCNGKKGCVVGLKLKPKNDNPDFIEEDEKTTEEGFVDQDGLDFGINNDTLTTNDDVKDKRIKQLEDENKSLKDQLLELQKQLQKYEKNKKDTKPVQESLTDSEPDMLDEVNKVCIRTTLQNANNNVSIKRLLDH